MKIWDDELLDDPEFSRWRIEMVRQARIRSSQQVNIPEPRARVCITVCVSVCLFVRLCIFVSIGLI